MSSTARLACASVCASAAPHSCWAGAADHVDRHTERLRHAVGGDVTVGRPDPAGGEDIGATMPERIECVDDCPLLVADHPHFLEINAERRQIFRDIAPAS